MVLSSHLVEDPDSPRLGMSVTASRLLEGSDASWPYPLGRDRFLKPLGAAYFLVQHQQVCQAK